MKRRLNSTHFLVDAMAIFFLGFDELVHYLVQGVREMFEVAVKFVTDGQDSKRGVVDQSRTQIGQSAWRMLTRILVQVACDQVICIPDGYCNEGIKLPA